MQTGHSIRGFVLLAVGALAAALLLAACGSSGSSTTDEAAGTTEGTTGTKEDAAGNGEEAVAGKPIVIGAAVAESGFMTAYDEPAMAAAKIAVEDINKKGGVEGRPLELKISNTRSDPGQAATSGQELVDDGAELLIASCDFDEGSPTAFVGEEKGIVTMSPCAADPKFGPEGIGPLSYTMGSGTPTIASIGAEWAFKEGKWNKVFALCDTTLEYTKSLCANFQQRWTELGGEIVGSLNFENGEESFDSLVSRMQRELGSSEVIYLASYVPGAATLIRAIRSAGIDLPIVSGEAMDGTYWLKSVPHLNDFYFPAYGYLYGKDHSPEIEKFIKQYRAANGGSLPPTSQAMTGYAVIQGFAQAIEDAGGSTGGAKVAEALDSFKEQPLILGPTTFTEQFHFAGGRPMTIVEVKDSKLVDLGTYKPEKVAEVK